MKITTTKKKLASLVAKTLFVLFHYQGFSLRSRALSLNCLFDWLFGCQFLLRAPSPVCLFGAFVCLSFSNYQGSRALSLVCLFVCLCSRAPSPVCCICLFVLFSLPGLQSVAARALPPHLSCCLPLPSACPDPETSSPGISTLPTIGHCLECHQQYHNQISSGCYLSFQQEILSYLAHR